MEPPLYDRLVSKMESMFGKLEISLDRKLDEKFGILFNQMKEELKAELKAELLAELKKELKAELLADLAKDTRTRASSQDETMINRVYQLEGVVESQARTARRSNLIIHGLPEDTTEVATARVSALFGAASGPLVAVSEARRLGAPNAARSKPRPILVSFSGVEAKHAALKHSKPLRQRQIFLDPDLTPQQQRIRLSLRSQYTALKAAGKQPFWREERLFIREGDRVREHLPVPGPPAAAAAAAGAAAAPSAAAPAPAPARAAAAAPAATPLATPAQDSAPSSSNGNRATTYSDAVRR